MEAAIDFGALDLVIVDDEPMIRDFLSRWIERLGARCRAAATGREGIAAVGARVPDIILLDIRLPDTSGIDVLRSVRALERPPEVILISGYADVPTAVQGFREGACDLVQKPFTIARLMEGIEVACARRARAASARREERSERPGAAAEPQLVALSPPMARISAAIERIALADATVLIEGETGTGKEIVARRLHQRSRRSAGPFVAVNCGAIPDSLIEAELFGHEAGAFTGAGRRREGLVATANHGTLLLDEVGELTPAAQVKLLRVLQERVVVPVGGAAETAVDLRVVAATNRDLSADVAAGRFRQDLLFRLDVVRLTLPPLRQRREDVPGLVDHLLARVGARYGCVLAGTEPEAIRLLQTYRFPGNVRELENIIERAIALGATGRLTVADLPAHVVHLEDESPVEHAAAPAAGTTAAAGAPPEAGGGVQTLGEAERRLFQSALLAAGGNREQAARMLGVSSKTVLRKIKKYGLQA